MKWALGASALALFLGGCASGSAAPGGSGESNRPDAAPTPIALRLDFTWGSEHLGYIMAEEFGYYDEAGLDVEISEGQGSAIGATLLASGEADIGVIAAGEILAGASRGLPIQAVASVLRNSPESIIYDADKVDVGSPKDLEGHSLGVDVATSNGKMWLAAAAADDVDLSKVNQVNAGKAVVQALLSGDVESIMGYSFNQGLQARSGGANVEFLSVADMGIDIPNHTIAVNTAWASSNEAAVQAFVDATRRGWEAVAADQEKALDVLMSQQPQLDRDMMSQKLEIFLELAGPMNEFGTLDIDKWETLNSVYEEQGLLEKTMDVEADVLNTNFVEVNR
ncbi:TPA: ABC transporter substrate-binding protein [Legionella pneumophila]|nr:ABC transporter substrate-binding protein [Legionella pneumophila]